MINNIWNLMKWNVLVITCRIFCSQHPKSNSFSLFHACWIFIKNLSTPPSQVFECFYLHSDEFILSKGQKCGQLVMENVVRFSCISCSRHKNRWYKQITFKFSDIVWRTNLLMLVINERWAQFAPSHCYLSVKFGFFITKTLSFVFSSMRIGLEQ